MALTLALMPKDTRNSYFVAAKAGAEVSARRSVSLVREVPRRAPGRRGIVDSRFRRCAITVSATAGRQCLLLRDLRVPPASGADVGHRLREDAREFFVSPRLRTPWRRP